MSPDPGPGDADAYEMQWDCPACATTCLLGSTHPHCPACGAAQDPSALYSPSHEQQVAVAAHPFVGRDLECMACHAANSAASNNCGSCGCPLTGARDLGALTQGAGQSGWFARAAQSGWFARASQSSAFAKAGQSGWFARATQSGVFARADEGGGSKSEGNSEIAAADSSGAFARAGKSGWFARATQSGVFARATQSGVFAKASQSGAFARAAEYARRVATQRQLASEAAAARSAEAMLTRRRMYIAGAAALITLIMVFIYSGRELELEVVGHSWSRTIEIEQFSEVREWGSCDAMPADAKLMSSRRQSNECQYRVNKWHTVDEAKAEGQGLTPAPTWPEVTLTWTGPGDCIRCEREGLSFERYEVSFSHDDDTTTTCEFEREIWASIAVGDTFDVAPIPEGGVLDCVELAARLAGN